MRSDPQGQWLKAQHTDGGILPEAPLQLKVSGVKGLFKTGELFKDEARALILKGLCNDGGMHFDAGQRWQGLHIDYGMLTAVQGAASWPWHALKPPSGSRPAVETPRGMLETHARHARLRSIDPAPSSSTYLT
eukprot:1160954-Pelagomonas_calceolata.AAC.6